MQSSLTQIELAVESFLTYKKLWTLLIIPPHYKKLITILSEAPSFYGFHVISRVDSSFLSVNNHSFELGGIACDVPQGSVLGPLLFLVCANNLLCVYKISLIFSFC